ncbi:MAG TPA: phosphonate dehydrogenase [Candidatus Angelobacter sp.]
MAGVPSPARPLVVVTHRIHEQVKELLASGCTLVANDSSESWPREKILDLAKEADGLMVFMPDSVDEEFLKHCPRLKIIAAALKGYDNFDVEACTRRGVWFTVPPDLLTAPTAELALGLILGITRNILPGDTLVRSGRFQGWRPLLYGSGLHGRTVGIVGMGKLGCRLAQLLAGFEVTIYYADRIQLPLAEERRLCATRLEFDQLLSSSDVVVLLLPFTSSTSHIINAVTLRQMKEASYLVNVGRGSVVDEAAVAEALSAGHLAGYAADVFEMEDWARPDHPTCIPPKLLTDSARTLFTPHLGSAVKEVRLQIELAAARNILQVFEGQPPADAINRPASIRRVTASADQRK